MQWFPTRTVAVKCFAQERGEMDITVRMDDELLEWYVQRPMVTADITQDPVRARKAFSERRAERQAADGREHPNPRVARRDVRVAGPRGAAADVRIRVYEPSNRRDPLPGVLFIHGGGFLVGELDDFDHWCEGWVDDINVVVASVEWRLAPEHPFPAGLNDCYEALRWLRGSADGLGVDRSRLAILGISAGGSLAAGLTLMVRDRQEFDIAFQMLLAPCLDDRHQTKSSREMTDPRSWNRVASLAAWRAYLGDDARDISPYAAPARADNLVGLPPTFIAIGQLDLMRDESTDYAARLIAAGIPTELHVYPGAFHGFEVLVPRARISRDALDAQRRAVRRALHPPGYEAQVSGHFDERRLT